MKRLKCEEIIQATGGMLISGIIEQEITDICTDSRTIKAGSLFIPIKGERFDGHDFIKSALENGAVGTLTHKDLYNEERCWKDEYKDKIIIKVNDNQFQLSQKIIKCQYEIKIKINILPEYRGIWNVKEEDMSYIISNNDCYISIWSYHSSGKG